VISLACLVRSKTQDTGARRTNASLTTILVGGVTLLILLAVGSVLWLTLSSATRNTFELLGQRSTATLDVLESQIDGQLLPVMAGVGEFSSQFADGRLDINSKRGKTIDVFSGFLASHPQVTAMLFVQTEFESIVVSRVEGITVEIPSTPDL